MTEFSQTRTNYRMKIMNGFQASAILLFLLCCCYAAAGAAAQTFIRLICPISHFNHLHPASCSFLHRIITARTMSSKILNKAVKNKQEGGKFWKPGQPGTTIEQETASKQAQKHDAIDDSSSTPKSPKILSKGVMSMKVELIFLLIFCFA